MATRTLFRDPSRDALTRAPALLATRRRQDWWVAVLFLTIVALPLSTNLLGIDTGIEQGENRKLAPWPGVEASWASIASFGSRLQGYFDDNFGFRARLIRGHALLDAVLLGVSPSPTVLWGREGWLFYADNGGIEDIVADVPFSDAELEVWRTTLVDNRDWLRARGIAYVFTVAPDKHAVYPEYLPSGVHRLGPRARMGQLIAYLRAHTDLVVVDLKRAMVKAKPEARLYDRTDTHWNRRGAYVGYRTLMDAVAERVPAAGRPWPLTDFAAQSSIVPGKDLAGMLGLRDVLLEEDVTLEPLRSRRARVVEPANRNPSGDVGRLVTEIDGSTLPRAVVFRDSFVSRLYPYLSEHFSRTVYLWQNDMSLEVVSKEKPAVVIHEIVGRHLTKVVPWNAVAADRKARESAATEPTRTESQ